jgi:Tol biopolymer transport system component
MWAIRTDGSGLHRLTPAVDGRADEPTAFSPDGSSLSFTRSSYAGPHAKGVHRAVYFVHLDGSGLHKVADRSADASFSNDGRRLVMATSRDNNGSVLTGHDEQEPATEIYTADLDGSNARRLTTTPGVSEHRPVFSPDDRRIAYQRDGDNFQKSVWQINADGSCPTPIAHDPKGDTWYSGPGWRPGVARIDEVTLAC